MVKGGNGRIFPFSFQKKGIGREKYIDNSVENIILHKIVSMCFTINVIVSA